MQNELVQLTCSQCGGNLIIEDDHYRCQNCGNTYERKYDLSNDMVMSLNRADTLRRRYFFDDAIDEYEAILSETETCTEAYWGAFLAEYGIEYVLDYDGVTYIPTCHRTSHRSVFDSKYYKGLSNDYKQKAKAIEDIRIAVLAEVEKASDYDVFICYKRKEPNASKDTVESKWARDLYENLTYKLGLKVFFAEKSLNKTNINWEPHIYSALMSSKLMVVLASSLDHINSAWVKNEWKRFNSFSTEENPKTIRVIASNIDPYNLPRELQDKQVLDQNSGNWLEDITEIAEEMFKGVITEINRKTYGAVVYKKKSFTKKEIKKRDFSHIRQGNVSASDESKLVLIENLLSMRKYDAAVQACDQLLQESSGCAKAYFLKFLANNNYGSAKEFEESDTMILSFTNFESAIALGSASEANEFLEHMINRAKNNPNIDIFEECISMPNITDLQVEDLSNHYFEVAVRTHNKELLDVSLKTISSDNVDTYITRNYSFAANLQSIGEFDLAMEIYKKILEVDMGHLDTQWNYYLCQNKLIEDTDAFKEYFINKQDFTDVEAVLNYGYNPRIVSHLVAIAMEKMIAAKEDDNLAIDQADGLFYFAIGCVPEDFDEHFIDYIDRYVSILIKKGEFGIATKYVNQLFVLDPSLDLDYYYRMLIDREYSNPIMFLKEGGDLMQDSNFNNAINFFTDAYPKETNIYIEMYKKIDWAKKNFKEADIDIIVDKCEVDILDSEYTLENFQNLCRSIVNQKKRHDARIAQAKLERKQNRKRKIRKVLISLALTVAVLVPIAFLYAKFVYPLVSNPVQLMTMTPLFQLVIFVALTEMILIYLIMISRWGFVRFVLLLLTLVPLFACGQFVYFLVMQQNPISNANELRAVADCPFGNYILTEDIELTDDNKWQVVSNFYGTLDGQGHTISNIEVEGKENVGLIKYNSGTIKNIVFEDVNILLQASSKSVGLVAEDSKAVYDNVVIKDLTISYLGYNTCYVTNFGSLVGLSKNSTIKNVTVEDNANNIAAYNVGGVVGKAFQTQVSNSSVENNVKSSLGLGGSHEGTDIYVGAIIGIADTNEGRVLEVKDCTYTGTNGIEFIGKKINDCRVVFSD
ncbi:MAG: TIR domain-containing protein [Clostridia bacterium]|nr:TIR domain-containing protein [Clostridia bacterium]